MIRYSLICEKGHEFEAWFASGAAYDAQADAGQVDCPRCGSRRVSKGVMAPNVATRPNRMAGAEEAGRPPAAEIAAQVRKFRDLVAETSENVGARFAEEARKIHYEETEPRSIYGSATSEEATALREEGVKFCPIPPLPEDHN